MSDIEKLRDKAFELKTAPIYLKTAKAEQLIGLLIGVLEKQQIEIDQLKGVKNG